MKTESVYRVIRTFFTVLWGVLVMACGGNTGDPEPEPDPDPIPIPGESYRAYTEKNERTDVRMSDKTIYIKDKLSADLDSYDDRSGKITFRKSDLLLRQEIKVGDILYSTDRNEKTPDGFCLRVLSVKESDGKITYETEPESLLEAIEYLRETNVLSAGNYKPEDIHVYSLPIEEADSPGTRAEFSWSSEDGVEIKGDKLNFKSDGKETSFDFIVWEDKASGDNTSGKFQVKLGIRVQHEFLNDNTESLTEIKDGNLVLFAMVKVGVGVKVEIGNSFKLGANKKEPEDMTQEERAQYEREKTLEDMAKASLVGKRFRLLDIPLNYTCTKVVIDPRFVVYGEFKLDFSGKLVVEVGVEDGVYALNVANDWLDFKKLSYLNKVSNFKQYFRINSSISFTADVGFGLGLNFEIPALPVKKDSYEGPSAFGVWFGFDLSEKVKVELNRDVMSGKTVVKAKGDDGEVSCRASISGVVGIKSHAVELDWTFWPKDGEPKELFTIPGWEWSYDLFTPSPYGLQSTVDGSSATLSWQLPVEAMFDETWIYVQNSTTGKKLSLWKTDCSGNSAIYGPVPDGTYFWSVETVSNSGEHFPSDTCQFNIDASTVLTGPPEARGDMVSIPVEIKTLNDVLEKGVVYSTQHREPLADVDFESHNNGTGLVFEQSLSDLQPSDSYYIRGYALISVDGGAQYVYGNVVAFSSGFSIPSSITVTPSEINFNTVEYGTDKTESFTVSNSGKGYLKFTVACECHDDVFEVDDGGQEYTLAPGASEVFTVTAHGMKRSYSAGCDIRVLSNAENGTQRVSVKAEGWDNEPLTLTSEKLTLDVGEKERVDVLFGSLDYELRNDNPEIVEAFIGTQGEGGGGRYDHWRYTYKYISIEALGKGTANLVVYDKERNEEVSIVVTVGETYILHDPYPEDGATGVETNVSLSCQGHLYDQGENNFEIRLSKNPDMSSVLQRVRHTGPSVYWVNFNLQNNTTYYWQVLEFDFDKEAWVIVSPIWHFTTK